MKSQEAALRAAPDILIATPGRLIDHLHNCPSFHLSSIEVLILDEADRCSSQRGAQGTVGFQGPQPGCGPATLRCSLRLWAMAFGVRYEISHWCWGLCPALACVFLFFLFLSLLWWLSDKAGQMLALPLPKGDLETFRFSKQNFF